jgi:nucleotide-binding universal stress UspA family protein
MASVGSSNPLVVVGVDGSPESVTALRWAAAYAQATGATIRAVIAWHYPAAVGPAPVGVAPKSVSDEVQRHEQEYLDKTLIEVYGTTSPDKVEPKIAYGHPAQALIDEARDADLLVVGNRGHGSFTGMLIGSVSIHCVTNAPCPVVVVRAE